MLGVAGVIPSSGSRLRFANDRLPFSILPMVEPKLALDAAEFGGTGGGEKPKAAILTSLGEGESAGEGTLGGDTAAIPVDGRLQTVAARLRTVIIRLSLALVALDAAAILFGEPATRADVPG